MTFCVLTTSVMLAAAASGAAPSTSASSTPSAVDRLAEGIRAQLTKVQPEAPVAVAIDGSPAPLARALATLTAAKLASLRLAPVVLEGGGEVEARALERGARSLLRVTVALEGQKLTARGDAYGLWVNFWSGRSAPRAGNAGLIVATLDADADALTLAGAAVAPTTMPATLEVKATVLAKLPGAPAAVTAADVDGDGRAEVVVVLDEQLLVVSSDGRTVARADLAAAAPSALPIRDVFAALAVSGAPSPARVTAWSGKRARAEVLGWASGGVLKSQGFTDSVSIDGVGVKLEGGVNAFAPEVVWAGRTVPLGFAPQATSTRGQLTLFVSSQGAASLTRGGPPTSTMSGVGCGSTLADLDGDGTAEVVLTTNRRTGEDEVRILSVAAFDAIAARSGTLPEASPLWQTPLARGRAIAATSAQLDEVPGEEVILATALADGTTELVVLHREAR